jgi:hypothetical protein
MTGIFSLFFPQYLFEYFISFLWEDVKFKSPSHFFKKKEKIRLKVRHINDIIEYCHPGFAEALQYT